MVHINNRPPGEQTEFEAREIIDAGFLELVRYGVRRADDPLILDTLKVVDHVLKVDTPQGPCWRRYNHDGYGNRADGGPFEGFGEGGAWPLLLGERAHYELAAGHDVGPLIAAYERFASKGGMFPEQIWDRPDLRGLRFGFASGAAMPLVWAHAEYLTLLRSAHDGEVFDRIPSVERRYAMGNAHSNLEVFKLRRQVKSVKAGCVLRIIAQQHFRVVWSADGWKTAATLESTALGFAGSYADLPTREKQTGQLSFTLFWTEENRWEGRNFDVAIE